MPWRQERFRVRDGLSLLVRICTPDAPIPAKTLLVIHGGCEHGGRYTHVVERFASRGWTSVIADHRGHGESEGTPMDVPSIEAYLDDLREICEHYCTNGPPVLLGHSFGGLLAIRLIETGLCARAAVLSAPFLGLSLRVPWWKYWLARGLRWIAPRARFRTGLDINNMTRDPEFLALRRADKLIQKRVTVRWFFAAQYGLILAHRDADKITCPVLALQGLDDRTVSPEALRRWWPLVRSENKVLWEFPGHVHEMLFDSDWQILTDRIADWLETLD